MKTRIVAIIIGLIIILSGGGAAYVILKQNNKPSAPKAPIASSSSSSTSSPSSSTSPSGSNSASILSADPTVQFTTEQQRYQIALAKAESWSIWNNSYQFSGLFITLNPDLLLDQANEVYVFDSPNDSSNHLTVSLSESTNATLRALIPITDYQGLLLPINRQYWAISYAEAVQIANKNGGASFMKSNKVTTIDADLMRTNPNDYLYWVITYHTADASTYLTVKIDAQTKTIVQ